MTLDIRWCDLRSFTLTSVSVTVTCFYISETRMNIKYKNGKEWQTSIHWYRHIHALWNVCVLDNCFFYHVMWHPWPNWHDRTRDTAQPQSELTHLAKDNRVKDTSLTNLRHCIEFMFISSSFHLTGFSSDILLFLFGRSKQLVLFLLLSFWCHKEEEESFKQVWIMVSVHSVLILVTYCIGFKSNVSTTINRLIKNIDICVVVLICVILGVDVLKSFHF